MEEPDRKLENLFVDDVQLLVKGKPQPVGGPGQQNEPLVLNEPVTVLMCFDSK